MSDKRFELVEAICYEVGKHQIEIMDNLEKQIVDKQKIADLLNHLSKENEELKQELNECANHKLYSRRKLEKENKELKQQLDKIPPKIKEVWLK